MKPSWKWRKQRGQDEWRPKDGQPYVVARVEGPELGYTATWTGDHPELLDTVLVGDDDEKSARETAQIVCESHAAKAERKEGQLTWVEEYPDWVSYQSEGGDVAYRCSPAPFPDGDEGCWTATGPEGVELGIHDDLDTAQVACQSHADQIALVDSPGFGATCDAVAASKPEHELVTRSILVQLSPEEHAEAGRLHAEARKAVQHAELILAAAVEEHKTKKKHLEGVVEGKKSDADALMQPALHGEEYRELQVHEQLGPDDGTGAQRDVIYTDPETGEELDRRPATKSELQKWLPGCEPEESAPDKPPESAEAQGDEPEIPAVVEQAAAAAERRANAEPDEVEFARGSTVSRCGRYSLRKQNGLWIPCSGPDGEVDLPRAGVHTSKRDAAAQCQEHLDGRLQWKPIAPGVKDQLVDGTGTYQVRFERDDWAMGWCAYHGEETVPDGVWVGEQQAKAACQADADRRRAGQ